MFYGPYLLKRQQSESDKYQIIEELKMKYCKKLDMLTFVRT